MIKQCTATRAGGVGRSYIYTPKARDTTVKEMLAEESKEYTFRPSIAAKSQQLAKNRGRGEVSIEVILNDEAYMKEQRMQHAKSMLEYDQNKECTFKPTLYATPKNVIPTYRGQRREILPEDTQIDIQAHDDDNEDDDVSIMTTSTCSTTIKPSFSSHSNSNVNANDMTNRVPVMRQKQEKEKVSSKSLGNLFPSTDEEADHGPGDQEYGSSDRSVRVDISDHMHLEAEENKQNLSADITLRWARHNDTN
jgi:hypothetical protein